MPNLFFSDWSPKAKIPPPGPFSADLDIPDQSIGTGETD